MQKKNLIFSLIAFFLITLACANPLQGTSPSVDEIVAATLQALTAPAQNADAPQDSTPSLLPHSLYFLNNDAAQLAQVFRLEKDGITVTQVTFEPAKVNSYDVSSVDGSVVYESNNQMILINADGSNRRVLLDGGSVDENNPFLTRISSPIFSPDNQTIAYGHGGLSFYSLATGQSNRVIENKFSEFSGGTIVPTEIYAPEVYYADGTKLLISISHYEGGTSAFYYLNGGALVQLQNAEGAFICCGEGRWTSDGSAVYAASPVLGMFSPGLWRIDASTGNVTTLLSGEYNANPINLADEPYLAPDGQLYFFHTTVPGGTDFIERAPLQLVRTAVDGVTNRVVLRPETFELLNEALWAPDASFVVVAMAPIPDVYFGGEARLVYTDGQKGVVPLVPFAQYMKWGP
jgi:Tol biopolymer transport system component